MSGTTVHITGVGSCTITATQAGDDTYTPADPVTHAFAITYASAGQCLGSPGISPAATNRRRLQCGAAERDDPCQVPRLRRQRRLYWHAGGRDIVHAAAGHSGYRYNGGHVEPVSTTPDTAFRWDPTSQQWIFNLSTRDLAAGATYLYSIGLDDGSSIEFGFGVR